MDHPQFDNSEIDVIRGYYRKNAVKITQGSTKQRRGIHVTVGNVSIRYVKGSSVYEWQLAVGNSVIAAGSHALLEAVIYDSQQAVKRMKQAALTLEVTP
jgi:uncharacterized protein YbjQ (UPF0145 family)